MSLATNTGGDSATPPMTEPGEGLWTMALEVLAQAADHGSRPKGLGHTIDHVISHVTQWKAGATQWISDPVGKLKVLPRTSVPGATAVLILLATEPGTERLAMPITGSWLEALDC